MQNIRMRWHYSDQFKGASQKTNADTKDLKKSYAMTGKKVDKK
jgi:hypothetical protein